MEKWLPLGFLVAFFLATADVHCAILREKRGTEDLSLNYGGWKPILPGSRFYYGSKQGKNEKDESPGGTVHAPLLAHPPADKAPEGQPDGQKDQPLQPGEQSEATYETGTYQVHGAEGGGSYDIQQGARGGHGGGFQIHEEQQGHGGIQIQVGHEGGGFQIQENAGHDGHGGRDEGNQGRGGNLGPFEIHAGNHGHGGVFQINGGDHGKSILEIQAGQAHGLSTHDFPVHAFHQQETIDIGQHHKQGGLGKDTLKSIHSPVPHKNIFAYYPPPTTPKPFPTLHGTHNPKPLYSEKPHRPEDHGLEFNGGKSVPVLEINIPDGHGLGGLESIKSSQLEIHAANLGQLKSSQLQGLGGGFDLSGIKSSQIHGSRGPIKSSQLEGHGGSLEIQLQQLQGHQLNQAQIHHVQGELHLQPLKQGSIQVLSEHLNNQVGSEGGQGHFQADHSFKSEAGIKHPNRPESQQHFTHPGSYQQQEIKIQHLPQAQHQIHVQQVHLQHQQEGPQQHVQIQDGHHQQIQEGHHQQIQLEGPHQQIQLQVPHQQLQIQGQQHQQIQLQGPHQQIQLQEISHQQLQQLQGHSQIQLQELPQQHIQIQGPQQHQQHVQIQEPQQHVQIQEPQQHQHQGQHEIRGHHKQEDVHYQIEHTRPEESKIRGQSQHQGLRQNHQPQQIELQVVPQSQHPGQQPQILHALAYPQQNEEHQQQQEYQFQPIHQQHQGGHQQHIEIQHQDAQQGGHQQLQHIEIQQQDVQQGGHQQHQGGHQQHIEIQHQDAQQGGHQQHQSGHQGGHQQHQGGQQQHIEIQHPVAQQGGHQQHQIVAQHIEFQQPDDQQGGHQQQLHSQGYQQQHQIEQVEVYHSRPEPQHHQSHGNVKLKVIDPPRNLQQYEAQHKPEVSQHSQQDEEYQAQEEQSQAGGYGKRIPHGSYRQESQHNVKGVENVRFPEEFHIQGVKAVNNVNILNLNSPLRTHQIEVQHQNQQGQHVEPQIIELNLPNYQHEPQQQKKQQGGGGNYQQQSYDSQQQSYDSQQGQEQAYRPQSQMEIQIEQQGQSGGHGGQTIQYSVNHGDKGTTSFHHQRLHPQKPQEVRIVQGKNQYSHQQTGSQGESSVSSLAYENADKNAQHLDQDRPRDEYSPPGPTKIEDSQLYFPSSSVAQFPPPRALQPVYKPEDSYGDYAPTIQPNYQYETSDSQYANVHVTSSPNKESSTSYEKETSPQPGYEQYVNVHEQDMPAEPIDTKQEGSSEKDKDAQVYHAYYAPADHKPPPGYIRLSVNEFNKYFKNAEIQYVGQESQNKDVSPNALEESSKKGENKNVLDETEESTKASSSSKPEDEDADFSDGPVLTLDLKPGQTVEDALTELGTISVEGIRIDASQLKEGRDFEVVDVSPILADSDSSESNSTRTSQDTGDSKPKTASRKAVRVTTTIRPRVKNSSKDKPFKTMSSVKTTVSSSSTSIKSADNSELAFGERLRPVSKSL